MRNEVLQPIRNLALASIAAGAMLLGACSDSPEVREVPIVNLDITDGSTPTTLAEGDRTFVLPGDDDSIAADIAFTKCGADGSVWSANAEPTLLNKSENKDLLESKQTVLFGKIGKNAATILADASIANPSADQNLADDESVYMQLFAGSRPIKLTGSTISNYPVRENYRCLDTDNSGMGDESVFRDLRDNHNATLLGNSVMPEDWLAAVEAAKADGIDLDNQLIVQFEKITLIDEDGNEVETDVVSFMFEDESCGNQVFKGTIPTRRVTTTTTTTTPTTRTTIPVKIPVPPVGPNTNPSAGGGPENGMDPQNDSDQNGYGPGDPVPTVAPNPEITTTTKAAQPTAETGTLAPGTSVVGNGTNVTAAPNQDPTEGGIGGDPGAPQG